ncbi:hypothetical protein NIES2100_60240 [Calothrix sp. NIES-2100]|nr:hypothetical protein NIES2100_60240 [Calothrix sp. NIES-2100]
MSGLVYGISILLCYLTYSSPKSLVKISISDLSAFSVLKSSERRLPALRLFAAPGAVQ